MMTGSTKICIITSQGGHFDNILQLSKLLTYKPKCWVTIQCKDTEYYLKNEHVYFSEYPNIRNLIHFVKNILFAIKIFTQEKPDILVSSGAGLAVPYLFIGKILFGQTILYIELLNSTQAPSLTGKIAYHLADHFLVHDKKQLKWFPNATLLTQLA